MQRVVVYSCTLASYVASLTVRVRVQLYTYVYSYCRAFISRFRFVSSVAVFFDASGPPPSSRLPPPRIGDFGVRHRNAKRYCMRSKPCRARHLAIQR